MYRRRASPLHAARAGVTAAYGLALAALALVSTHPLLLGAVALAVAGAAVLAGVGRDLAHAARFAAALALLLALVNALVVREGLTVILQLGEIPPFGLVDVTFEALVAGLLIGARVVVVVLAFALLAACVDPDAALRGLGRLSLRSALTAVLATRMIPVLARDARRMELALRTRPGADPERPATRLAVVRALATGALERAVDVAATLELRGYGRRGGRTRGLPAPWSRHDRAVLAAAIALAALVLWTALGEVAAVEPYPRLSIAATGATFALAGGVVAAALLPFAARKGIAGP